MIPILPCTTLKPPGETYDVKAMQRTVVTVMIIMAIWFFGYAVGFKDGKKQGEIKVLKAVAKIMVGALDGAANK